MDHSYLVQRAERWLSNTVGCGVVFAELCAVTGWGEIPDAIGFRGGSISILVECKTSRADFLADKNKIFREHPERGMGDFRFYLTPPDVVRPEDLPPGWGLLWCRPKKIERVVAVVNGNCAWSGPPPFQANKKAEMEMMYSALRRVHLRGDLKKIYTHTVDDVVPELTS